MAFLILFLVPLLVAGGTFILAKHRVIWQEFVSQFAASLVVAGVSVAIIYHQNVSDTEILNGSVTSKAQVKVSCSHSYCCRWCTRTSGSGKNKTTTRYCCRTCYDHPYDFDWDVYTTVGEFEISRLDRQGVQEPPRWTSVRKGEPVSRAHSYTNYVKAAPDSLFRDQGLVERFEGKLPTYPGRIYDYYRVDRFVAVGGKVGDAKLWNEGLSEMNARIGAPKQANVIVVVAPEDEQYFYALRQHWLGGKKNDIIVVLGSATSSTAHPRIRWAHVMSWSQSDIFNVKLRDDLTNISGFIEPDRVLPIIEHNVVGYFQRKPMADFEYLESSITPTTGQLVWASIINLIIAIGISVFVVKNDINQERKRKWARD